MDNQYAFFFRLSAVLEAMPDALVIVDEKGRIVLINQQTENLFGYERTELLGEHVECLMPERFRQRHQQHRTHFFEAPRTRPMGANLELFGLRKNKEEFPIELSLSPLKTDEGTLVLAAVRDISVQKNLQAQIKAQNHELLEATKFLNSVLESSTGYSIIAIDLQGKILAWNEGAHHNYGYTAEETIGKFNYEVLHLPEDVKSGRVQALLDKALQESRADDVFERIRKDGSRFFAAVSATVRRSMEGEPNGYVIISKDITEQKRLEAQLRAKNEKLKEQNQRIQEANRLKSEFLANMSHELRTPLNAIIGFSELMHSGKVGTMSEDHREYVGDILTSSKHLLQLINDVLDLAKIEAGRMEFYPEKVHLKKLVTEVGDILKSLIAKKHIKMDIEVDPKVDNVVIDPAKFKQVIYNYVSNAIKFTPDQGHVKIKIADEGQDKFRLEVIDTGIGIEPDAIHKLFIEFQQLDSSIGKKYQGTGLGLALTKRIIEAQGGEVGVRSTPGQGSTFFAILAKKPVTQIACVRRVNKIKKLKRSKSSGPIILVIEDDLSDQQFITKTLENAGYQVQVASNGKEALECLNTIKYDAITLDLLLPDINGWDILRTMHELGPNSNTPVIVLTVVSEKSASFSFRVEDFLIKPLSSQDLLIALRRIGITKDSKKKVMVVDDDLSALKLTKVMLEKLGHKAICKTNGKEGLAALEQELPDVIILDLLMPELNGFEFLQALRSSKENRHIPVIIWTAKEFDYQEREYLQAYAQAVVLKEGNSMETLLSELAFYLTPMQAKED